MPPQALRSANPMPPTPYVHRHSNTPKFMLRTLKAQFDALYERGADKPVLMPLTVHERSSLGGRRRSSVLDQFIPYARKGTNASCSRRTIKSKNGG